MLPSQISKPDFPHISNIFTCLLLTGLSIMETTPLKERKQRYSFISERMKCIQIIYRYYREIDKDKDNTYPINDRLPYESICLAKKPLINTSRVTWHRRRWSCPASSRLVGQLVFHCRLFSDLRGLGEGIGGEPPWRISGRVFGLSAVKAIFPPLSAD